MKKCISLLCISLFAAVLIFPIPILAKDAIIHTDNLNVRSGLGEEYDKIGQVDTDETYTIKSENDGWVEIDLGDESGWVTTDYISISDSESVGNDPDKATDTHQTENNNSDNDNHQESKGDIIIDSENTQIRNEPSTSGDIVYFASENETFTISDEKDDWYQIKNDEADGFIHKRLVTNNNERKKTRNGLRNKTIVLDAGHGGRDVGAIGMSGDYEKTFTYQTTMELEKELKLLGADVILTRETDEFISLGGRTSLANIKDTDALISIHYNSTPDLPEVNGIGTYYYHDQHKDLAKAVQNGVIQITDANDRGTAFENFHVIRQSFKPSILIELGFISNEKEENLLKRSPYQKKIVTGILHGLQQYFNK